MYIVIIIVITILLWLLLLLQSSSSSSSIQQITSAFLLHRIHDAPTPNSTLVRVLLADTSFWNLQCIIFGMVLITCHASYVTRHTSHVTRHTTHVSRDFRRHCLDAIKRTSSLACKGDNLRSKCVGWCVRCDVSSDSVGLFYVAFNFWGNAPLPYQQANNQRHNQRSKWLFMVCCLLVVCCLLFDVCC